MPQFFKHRLTMLTRGKTFSRLPQLSLLMACYSILAVTIYLWAELGQWSPTPEPPLSIVLRSIGFFFLPALAEELVWRWTLVPPGCVGRFDLRSMKWIFVTSLIFTAAHPVAGYFFVPHVRDYFLQPAFLAIVFLLGLTCGTSYVWSKSIWPPVLIHWITVLAWKFLLDGPKVLV